MSAATETLPVETFTDPDDLDHIVCDCDELLALCGLRLAADVPYIDDDEAVNCVDCYLLADVPCPRCGE